MRCATRTKSRSSNNGVDWHSKHHEDPQLPPRQTKTPRRGARSPPAPLSLRQHAWNTKRDKVEAILRRAFGVRPVPGAWGARHTGAGRTPEYGPRPGCASIARGISEDGPFRVASRHIGSTYRARVGGGGDVQASAKAADGVVVATRWRRARNLVAGGLGKILKYLAPAAAGRVVSRSRLFHRAPCNDAGAGSDETGESLQLFLSAQTKRLFPRERFDEARAPGTWYRSGAEGESEDRGAGNATGSFACFNSGTAQAGCSRRVRLKFAVGNPDDFTQIPYHDVSHRCGSCLMLLRQRPDKKKRDSDQDHGSGAKRRPGNTGSGPGHGR